MRPIPGADLRRLSFRAPHPEKEQAAFVSRFEALGKRPGVQVEKSEIRGKPFLTLKIPATGPRPLRVFLTGGAHGDERASQPALLRLIDWVMADPKLRERVELTVVPFINPTGYALDIRHNDQDINVNREYFEDATLPEVTRTQAAIGRQPPHLSIDFHGAESMKDGFFLIGNDVDGRRGQMEPEVAELAGRALDRIEDSVPLCNKSSDLYFRNRKGLFTAGSKGILNGYMGERGTKAAFTVEAPHVLSYKRRVEGLVAITQRLVEESLAAFS